MAGELGRTSALVTTGNTEGDECVTVARHDIKIMAYNNEPSFSFKKYSMHLKKVFSTLE